MKSLPKLYSRTSTGAIQEWTIMIDGNKFRVESGQQNGAKVLSEWTTCKGKNTGKANETSDAEQAQAEAEAKWKKKVKSGGYTEDIKRVDDCMTFIAPMLAKDFDDYAAKLDYAGGLFVQNKYNGVRCVATFEAGRVVLKSRKGELWVSVPHINKDLKPFFEKHPDAVLDGELYNYDLRQKLNELTKIVRKTKPKELTPELLKRSEEMVRFYIYDGFDFAGLGEDTPYKARKEWIDKNLPKFCSHYREVKTFLVTSKAELDKLYNSFLADGEEGAIIRVVDSPYQVDKRSKFLLKYKPEDDDEGIVTALQEGTGNWAGTAKTATILWKGIEFQATFKGTWEQGAERLKNPKLFLNKKVTFHFTGLTGKGVPNYARIDPDNCFKGDR